MTRRDQPFRGDRYPGIITFGAYDLRKPRVRLLIDGIRSVRALEADIFIDAWGDVPQTNIPSRASLVRVILRMMLGYPGALFRLVRAARRSARGHRRSAVLLPYPGVLEILFAGPLARLLGLTVVLDAFLPVYDTIHRDRSLVGKGLIARAIWLFERAALRCADIIVVDTDAHARYFAEEFGFPPDRFHTVLVGAEPLFAPDAPTRPVDDLIDADDPRPIVLFYGQLIPLHGVSTIIEAARISTSDARWILIGRGQLEPQVERWIEAGGHDLGQRLTWIKWVDYERLPSVIARADICLGVFGASDKAARVIPNKLFQQAAMGKPVITRASPAVDWLATNHPDAVRTVPADDPRALADAVAEALADPAALAPLPAAVIAELGPEAGIRRLLERLEWGGS